MRPSYVLGGRGMGIVYDERGLMNIQFAVKDGVVYVIEASPRASRTVPFATTLAGAQAMAAGMQAAREGELDVRSLQER